MRFRRSYIPDSPAHRSGDRCHQRRGFTLIELAIVIIVIALLASLALVAISHALAAGRLAAERATVVSMKIACTQFISDFGMDVPMVNDQVGGGPVDNSKKISIRDSAFLGYKPGEGRNPTQHHYSELSLTYYLTGVLPAEVDGKEGPGFTAVGRDGQFSRTGKIYGPYTDVERDRRRMESKPNNISTINDRWGHPLRYYLWYAQPDDPKQPGNDMQYFAPRLLGDPKDNAAVRGAHFAIVSLGPDGKTDDRGPFPGPGGDISGVTQGGEIESTTTDDITEVGP